MHQKLARPKRRRGRPPAQVPQAPVSIRLPVGILQRLQRQSQEVDRPISYLVRSIVMTAMGEPTRPQPARAAS